MRGLGRSLVLEALLFVPCSVLLVLVLHPILPLHTILNANHPPFAFYGVLGIVGYVFPFAALRRIVRGTALRTLKQFASIVADNVREEAGETPDEPPEDEGK